MFYTWPELKLNLKDYIFVPSAWYPWNHINERGSETISFVETYSHLHTHTHAAGEQPHEIFVGLTLISKTLSPTKISIMYKVFRCSSYMKQLFPSTQIYFYFVFGNESKWEWL